MTRRSDWESDPRPLGLCLKSWAAAHGWTRATAAAELRVPISTYDKWCDGGRADREATVRRLMTMIDRTRA